MMFEQIATFKQKLIQKIMNKIYESEDEVIQMICDYGPDRILYDTLKESGISTLRIPYKVSMYN